MANALQPQSRRFYGRRQGRKLSPQRQALLERLLLEFALDISDAAQPGSLFAKPVKGLWLEIGFGGGEHLAWQAAQNPDIGFIGCEPFVNGVASLLALIEKHHLSNIRIFADDARLLLAALPAASLQRVFLLHPDPWPKARHAKRRFIQAANLNALSRVMVKGAELRIATDDPGLSAWTAMQLAQHRDFAWLAEQAGDWRHRPADWPQTRYEAKAAKSGRRSVYLRYQRR